MPKTITPKSTKASVAKAKKISKPTFFAPKSPKKVSKAVAQTKQTVDEDLLVIQNSKIMMTGAWVDENGV
jgi:hypothetical protein